MDVRLALVSSGILGTEQADNHAAMTLDMTNTDRWGRLRYCLKDSIKLPWLNSVFVTICSWSIKKSGHLKN